MLFHSHVFRVDDGVFYEIMYGNPKHSKENVGRNIYAEGVSLQIQKASGRGFLNQTLNAWISMD